MARSKPMTFAELLVRHKKDVLDDWLSFQLSATTLREDLMDEKELRRQCEEFIDLMATAAGSADMTDASGEAWTKVRDFLSDVARSRAAQGFTPSETATFVFSLRQPVFDRLRTDLASEPARLTDELWTATVVLDKLGLHTMEVSSQSRDDIIRRQQAEMLELSTPVVKMWEGILVLPLIGTLDSARTQVITENLLQTIVESGSSIAIIDITGVPTVDTLVAQHLLKTVAAARLMGADCLISGIRPQIAQTMVHLGVAFSDVLTKSTLSDALAYAFRSLGLVVTRAPSH